MIGRVGDFTPSRKKEGDNRRDRREKTQRAQRKEEGTVDENALPALVFQSSFMVHCLLLKKERSMSRQVLIPLEMPDELGRFSLPPGLNRRLQALLEKQDQGESLNPHEVQEAEGLVELAELLSLMKLRARTQSASHLKLT